MENLPDRSGSVWRWRVKSSLPRLEKKRGTCRIETRDNETPSPDRLDFPIASCVGEIFTYFADEHVENFCFRFIDAGIHMIDEHIMRHGLTLPRYEQLDHAILLSRKVQGLTHDCNCSLIEIDDCIA